MLERRYSFEMITAIGAGVMVAASVVTALVMIGGPDALIKTVHDDAGPRDGARPGLLQDARDAADDSGRHAGERHLAHDASVAGVRAAGRGEHDAAQPARVLAMGRAAAAGVQPVRRSFAMVGAGMDGVAVARERVRAVHPGLRRLAISRSTASSVSRRFIFARDWRSSDSIFSRSRCPSIVRGIIYFVVFAQPVVAALVSIAGVFDMWIDFRRLKPPSPEANNLGDFFYKPARRDAHRTRQIQDE